MKGTFLSPSDRKAPFIAPAKLISGGAQQTPRNSGAVPGWLQPCTAASAANDLARPQAGGAHVHALAGAANLRVHGLNVRVPPAPGLPVGVRDRIAEARPLATDVADGSHVRHPLLCVQYSRAIGGGELRLRFAAMRGHADPRILFTARVRRHHPGRVWGPGASPSGTGSV